MTRKILLVSILLTVVAGGQILATWLLYNPLANTFIINLGWSVLLLSAIFGWLPIFTFRSRGNINGRSYTDTTVVVYSGIYGIVRHPQYLAGMLINIALPLITQHGLVLLLGLFTLVVYYWNTFIEEEENLRKFGEPYRDYQSKVPRVNFLLGLFRLVHQKK